MQKEGLKRNQKIGGRNCKICQKHFEEAYPRNKTIDELVEQAKKALDKNKT